MKTEEHWDNVTFVIATYYLLTIPFRIAFQYPLTPLFLALDALADSLLLIDFVYHLRIHSPQKKSRAFFARRWKSFDSLAILPLDWIALIFGFAASPLIIAALRCNKLLRLCSVLDYILERPSPMTDIHPLKRISKRILLTLVLTHVLACLWFILGYVESAQNVGWLVEQNLVNESIFEQYMRSVYWSLTTITTVGYGDITPQTSLEIAYTMLVMLSGVTLWGYILATVTAYFTNRDSTATAFRERIHAVEEFLNYKNIPTELRSKVTDYYRHLWTRNKALDDADILSDLPNFLRIEVGMYLNREILQKVPFFNGMEVGFFHSLVTMLKPEVYCPGDVIICQGAIGQEMYFITDGEVEVYCEDNQKVLHTISPGNFFGEMGLLFHINRTASVRAKTYCDLYVLTKEDFDQVAEHYPEFTKKVESISNVRRADMQCDLQSNEDRQWQPEEGKKLAKKKLSEEEKSTP